MSTVEDARTLPFAWYTGAEALREERARVFARSWQYGGRAATVAEPGSYLATDAAACRSSSCAPATESCARS